ncbi:Leucine-rich repeat-containing protein 56 [Zootermopsis nevadensis]|uniref:Leucine-rich repeat-containing protein 56 n=2 Tax=Zootermopsis nevadensis TaxID=136037 RepID=A0A067RKJ3_ZOONE|nr:Leucine-rich repeat-containing protein 56 [Zootermopsis nevadensis]
MSPYCHQTGHMEPSGSTHGAADLETADPETGTPTPSPTPSATPSPPSHPEEPSFAGEDGQSFLIINPPPALQNGASDCLPIDHNLPRLLRQVSGNADLISVRDIKLRVISREMSLHRLALFVPNLRELNLEGSFLGSLRDLGCGLASLNVLRVSRCGLESLDGTFGLTNLRELHASHNMVDDASPCSALPHIRIIDLGKNAVEDVRSLEFLGICSHLEYLTLAECPVSSTPNYQARIRRLLPNLVTLDGIPVTQVGQEQNSEHIDDDDVGIGYQRRGFFRPRPRCYKLRHHGLESSGDKHPTTNKDGYSKQADGTDGSSMSNMGDSPDCSSSSYRTYTGLHSTQSSVSDSTLTQNWKKNPRKATIKKRPATAVIGALEASHGQTSKARPSSAATTKDEGDLSGACVVDPRCDSSSLLTSGMVVCGNLTAALRSRRKRHDAWTEEDFPSPMQSMTESRKTDSSEGRDIREENPGILVESKTLNEVYAVYRPENRFRWEKEDSNLPESVAEKCNQVETKNAETATDEDEKSADVNNSQIKAPPSCCPHLFMRQKPMRNTSHDSDTNLDLQPSPEAEREKTTFLCLTHREWEK